MSHQIKPYDECLGYTQFDNALIDYCMPQLNPSDWKVITLVVRKTRGWHKRVDAISLSQVEKGAGISRPTAIASLERLVSLGHLIRVDGLAGRSNTYGLNPDFSINVEDDEIDLTSKEFLPEKQFASKNILLANTLGSKESLPTKESIIKENTIGDFSLEDLVNKPYTELQDLCKSLGKDGHLVLVNYWYQLTGSKTPKLERNGLPTTIAKKLKVNYATFLKDKGFFEDVFPAMRDYALNIVPIKKDWATLEWFLGTGKDSKGPGWKRVAEKQAWLYRPDEGKNGTPNKPDVQPLYYTP